MDNLTTSLQALNTGDINGERKEPAKHLASALDSSTARSAPRPSLETLPVELHRLILSNAPTIKSLSALVHASPELHRVYVEDRLPILRSVAEEILQGMLIDALGVYHSGTELFQKVREQSLLWAFVEKHEARYAIIETDWTAELSLDDIIHILHFHTSVIEPLAERYASWALASLPSTKGRTGQQSLSDIERRRIQRALYRMQLFCNVCGSLGEGYSAPERIEDNIDRLRVLSMFPAWEIEEILCIHEFAKNTYRDVLRRVAWDLNEERNPKYLHIDITSVNEDLMLICENGAEDGYINPGSLNAVLRHGLRLLSDTFKTEHHEQLVDMMRAAIVSGMGRHRGDWRNDWIDDAVESSIQMDRREQWYSHRDSAQDWRQKMPFDGDSLDLPPLAWVLLWKGEYSNLTGNTVPMFLRRWGFVMWDAARLEQIDKEWIESEWLDKWGGEDPREEDYDSSVVVERYTEEWWRS